MERVSLVKGFWYFGWMNIEVDHDRLLAAADDHTTQRLVRTCVDLLVGDEGRHKNEITGSSLCDKLQVFSPAHPCPPADHVNNAFQRAVMMGARFGIRVN